jgi:4-O-beta-D-mannosyl-D-glucose phosphorylase
VLYVFLSKIDEPQKVLYEPGGYFMAPMGEERVGDVSNVVFSNRWVARANGDILIYYASSDTRMHVATTSIDRMLDYVTNTPPDPLRSFACVLQRSELIRKNLEYSKK